MCTILFRLAVKGDFFSNACSFEFMIINFIRICFNSVVKGNNGFNFDFSSVCCSFFFLR